MQGKAAVDPMVQRDPCSAWRAPTSARADAKTPLASPLFADLPACRPLLLHVGTAETLLDDSTRFAERARAAPVST